MPLLTTRGVSNARGWGRGRNFVLDMAAFIPVTTPDVVWAGAASNTGSVSSHTILITGSYEIELAGGIGGVSFGMDVARVGKGNIIIVRYNLEAGTVLYIVAGGAAINNTSGNTANGGGHGGGGSFVWTGAASGNLSTLIAAAGGGGGASIDNVAAPDVLANTLGRNGNTLTAGVPSWSLAANFGSNGADGAGNLPSKGWISQINGGVFSSTQTNAYGGLGGYGGGGGPADTSHGGGGGGGYSGGGAGAYSVNSGSGNADGRNGGGGGGSYAISTSRFTNMAFGSNTVAGKVTLRPATA